MWHGITTTQAFQQFEANLDVGTTTYERLQEGIGFVSEAIFATFPTRMAPPAAAPPGGAAVILGTRRPRPVELELVALRPMGSYVRQTLVATGHGPADADIAVVFQADSPYDAYTSFGVEQLVRSVADALAVLGRPVMPWAGQAVTVSFGSVNIDVWPTFRLWNDGVFQFPRQGNAWFRSNPHVLDERFNSLDGAMNGGLASIARCMKVWNGRKGSLLQSFYLESLIMREAGESYTEKLQVSLRRLFETASRSGAAFLSVGSQDGASVDLAASLSYEERVKVTSAFASAARIANRASVYEGDQKFAAANLCWRRIFGPLFPEETCTDAELLGDPELAWLTGLVRAEEGELGTAHTLFRNAATAGHPDAALSLARLFSLLSDEDQAQQWLITAANGGIAGAAFTLAEKHSTDDAEQLAWYQRAADLGHPVAMIVLAMRASAAGDLTKAETWYRNAIAKGSARAMVNLGIILVRQPDRAAEVIRWWRLAAANGDLQARGLLADRLGTDVSTAEEAQQLWESAANDGDAKSMVSLAVACERTGRIAEAASWYRRASTSGSKDAALALHAAMRWSQLGGSGRYLKWHTGDRWVAVDPVTWARERLQEHFSASPDRLTEFENNLQEPGAEFAVIILNPPSSGIGFPLNQGLSESIHTELSDDRTLFTASLAADRLIISSPGG